MNNSRVVVDFPHAENLAAKAFIRRGLSGTISTMAMAREDKDRKTLEAIGRIYCSAHHDGPKDVAGLCAACRKAVDTTLSRTASCPYGHVGNCQDCLLHCQRGEAQAQIQEIMRYAAPRMAFRHPLMALEYLRKKRKQPGSADDPSLRKRQ